VTAAWLTAKDEFSPTPTQMADSKLNELGISNIITPITLGTVSAPLAIDDKRISFGYRARLCIVTVDSGITKLASRGTNFTNNGQIIIFSNFHM
jgi:hypothetical protein